MKKRISALFLALAMSTSLLSGCNSQTEQIPNDNNSELLQAIADLSNEISQLRGMLTLAPGALIGEEKNISDEDGANIDRLIAENERNYLAGGSSDGIQVKNRDWSKYTSESAKSNLTASEAKLYERFDAVCKDYLNDPSHGVIKWNDCVTTKGARYSDLGLEREHAYDVLWWFKYNNPQYYFLKGASYTSTQLYMTFYDFVSVDDPAKTTNEMFDKLDSWIVECCDDETTTWEKILSANKKICEAVIYDPKVKAKVEGAAGGKNQSLYSVMMTPEAVCAGYAMAFGAMANSMGIDTYVVLSDTHAWNATRFDDGNYYFVDVCWNDEDNGYNEKFIGAGTDYSTYRDQGGSAHIYEVENANWSPIIPKSNYQGSNNTSSLTAPKLRVSGKGSSAVKVEWDAVGSAEKYEYSVSNGSSIIFTKTTEDLFAYLSIPSGLNSVSVKVRAQGTENGKTVYSAWSDITASADSSAGKPAVPTDIKSSINSSNGLSLTWTNATGSSVLFCYGEDSTFTKVWFSGACKNGSGWKNWNPEKENYFAIASISKNGSTESISDPVKFSYSKSGGINLITGNNDSAASSVAAPGNFHAWKQPNGGAVQCNWDAVSGADGYEIQLSYNSDFSNITGNNYVNSEKTAIAYVIKSTWPAMIYFRARAVKGDSYSDWVTTAFATENSGSDASSTSSNGHVIKTESNGDVYRGMLQNGKKDGFGFVEYSNGTSYMGEWKNNVRNGLGLYTYAGGDMRFCNYENGKNIDGFGTYKWSEAGYYTGMGKNGLNNGYGIMVWSSGAIYAGDWVDSKQTGEGALVYDDGSIYMGSWKDGKWDGKGIRITKDGKLGNVGTWKEGKISVKDTVSVSTFRYDDGTYIGESSSGKPHGYGYMKYDDGSVYAGKWVNGIANNCSGIWRLGDVIYAGEWKNDIPGGYGTYIYQNGNIYCGFIENDKRSGQGIMLYSNGNIYSGEWKNDSYNGEGTFMWKEGDLYHGEFKSGKRDGQGTYWYDKDSFYVGEWKDGKKEGKGKMTSTDGTFKEGTWKDGSFIG